MKFTITWQFCVFIFMLRHRNEAYEAERHKPAPRLWAAFSRAAPCVANIKLELVKDANFHLEFEEKK